MMSTKDLSGRTAIVTGGSSGLGAAHTRALVERGARVLIADISAGDGSLERELGDRVRFFALDVSDEQGWADAVAAAGEWGDPVDILVNNAGISIPEPIEDLSLDSWRRTLDVNLTGHFLGLKAVIPGMKAAGGGAIVNTSSMVATLAVTDLAAYGVSKHGVVGLTRAAALELGRYGIRVNVIHPGLIDTPMNAGVPKQATDGLPISRFGRPEEIAALAVFLIADATYTTGSAFAADGGIVVGIPRVS
jgi:3alpha(or 20beta)-hydroxysteroid dehydrogenase